MSGILFLVDSVNTLAISTHSETTRRRNAVWLLRDSKICPGPADLLCRIPNDVHRSWDGPKRATITCHVHCLTLTLCRPHLPSGLTVPRHRGHALQAAWSSRCPSEAWKRHQNLEERRHRFCVDTKIAWFRATGKVLTQGARMRRKGVAVGI